MAEHTHNLDVMSERLERLELGHADIMRRLEGFSDSHSKIELALTRVELTIATNLAKLPCGEHVRRLDEWQTRIESNGRRIDHVDSKLSWVMGAGAAIVFFSSVFGEWIKDKVGL